MWSLVPQFQLGLFNAWILTAPLMILAVVGRLSVNKSTAMRLSDMTGYSVTEKLISVSTVLLSQIFVFICILIPLQYTRLWLVLGLALYVAGLGFMVAAFLTYARAPSDKLARQGVYKISRNPIYVGCGLFFVGISTATQSLFLLGILLVLLVLQHFQILAEERVCRGRYGEGYAEYFRSVPRYMLFL